MDKREDIRITKSKRDLCNALITLMQTEQFKKITVGDICSTAMVNRMTFYKHYADKYELLNDVLLNIKHAVVERIAKMKPSPDVTDEGLDLTFRLVDAVIDICLSQKELLFKISGDDMVLTIISTVIEKSVYELLQDLDRRHPFKYRLDALSPAVTGAATFLIRHWLAHEPETTKERFVGKTKEFLRGLFSSKILFD